MSLTRALAAGWIVFALQAMPAQACRGPQFEHSIVLPDLNGVDAPVAMQVTITKMIKEEFVKPGVHVPPEQYTQRYTLVGVARVEKMIRGEFNEPFVRIAVLPTSCGPVIRAGLSGIVAGRLERDAEGAVVLKPVWESEYMRQNRLKARGG
ncbi:MAG: hypothetical protein ABWY66_08150 [Xanthobacteraceae bacterium]|jgi:hypothetical protein